MEVKGRSLGFRNEGKLLKGFKREELVYLLGLGLIEYLRFGNNDLYRIDIYFKCRWYGVFIKLLMI